MPRKADEVLESEFLQVRAKILEIGAFFDRIEQADGDSSDKEKLQRLKSACEILCEQSGEKAKQIQLHFSREYEEAWRQSFGI